MKRVGVGHVSSSVCFSSFFLLSSGDLISYLVPDQGVGGLKGGKG